MALKQADRFVFFSCPCVQAVQHTAMHESIVVRFSLHAPAKAIYDAWLDSAKHTAMTGSPARASRVVGGEFAAWDGYITGKNLLLIESKKIVQSWRSSEFPEEAPDSVLSVLLTEREGITEVELEHRDIPPGQGVQYQSGWIEFYANPMQKFFSGAKAPAGSKKTAAKRRSATPKKTTKRVPKKSAGPVKKKVVAPKRGKKKALSKGR